GTSIIRIRPSSLLRSRSGPATPYTLPRRVTLTQCPSSPREKGSSFSSGRTGGAAPDPAVGGDATTALGAVEGGGGGESVVDLASAIARDKAAALPLPRATAMIS